MIMVRTALCRAAVGHD